MAECILKSMANKNNLKWVIDSAALREWNVGGQPEARCIQVLAENNLSTEHIGRQVITIIKLCFVTIFSSAYL